MFDLRSLHLGHAVVAMYAVLAGSVAYQLWRRGRHAFDDVFTDRDRALVGATTFYLGLPLVLLLHELTEALTLLSMGASFDDARAWFVSGALPAGKHGDEQPLGVAQIVLLSLSGKAVSCAVGATSVYLAVRRPRNAAWNFARLELGRVVIGVVIVLHPTLSLVLDQGSLPVLRRTLNTALSHVGDLVALAHVVVAVLAVRWSRGARVRAWYVELATPLFHAIDAAKRRVALEPFSATAQRELGGTYLAAGRFDLAAAPLQRATELDPTDARGHFLFGMYQLKQDDPRAAELSLCNAGQQLDDARLTTQERRGLELEITIALATARLRQKDADGALATAEVARDLARRDPRVLMIYSDALVAVGRSDEASAPLSLALQDAQGSVELEIRRRLQALERGR